MPQTQSVFGLVEQDLVNRNYSAAMKRLVSVSNTYSSDSRFLSLLSFTQKALGDLSGQIKTLQVIANLTQAHVAYLDYMSALYNEGRLNEALDIGLILQEMELNDINARYFARMMVKIYLEFCDYEGVEEVLARYEIKHEMDDLMLWALGFVSLAYSDQNKAVDYFRRAVEMNPANDQAWVSLAMLHEDMGDRELALANLEKALDANPQNATGLKMMAKWHRTELEATRKIINRLDYYLSNHNFDEEVSLCYVQLLAENNSPEAACFEIDKQILNNPNHQEFLRIKNNLQIPANP
ncbi:MAG: tetratricopeptide repeat protein [Pseudobdellovibrio sp.]